MYFLFMESCFRKFYFDYGILPVFA
jgi:hypothetical protein